MSKIHEHVVNIFIWVFVPPFRRFLQKSKLFKETSQLGEAFLKDTFEEVTFWFTLSAEVHDCAYDCQRQLLGCFLALHELEVGIRVSLTGLILRSTHELLAQMVTEADAAEFLEYCDEDVLRDAFKALTEFAWGEYKLRRHPV